MIGVFSERTLFDYILKQESKTIDEKLVISDLGETIDIHNHVSEAFIFVKKEVTVIEIEDIFRKGFKGDKRIAVVFITEDGTETGELLGLVSAWEVARYNIT